MKRKQATRRKPNEIVDLPPGLREGAQAGDRYYDFGNSAVLLTHPAINGGETFQGCFTGYWVTRSTSRTDFRVTQVDARLVLPAFTYRPEGAGQTRRVAPGSVFLSLGKFGVPESLREVFHDPNHGRVDAKSRTYRATFALDAQLPFAADEKGELGFLPARVLFLTVGSIEQGGALTAGGLGRILDGRFGGLMFVCGHPSKKPITPQKCRQPHPTAGYHCLRDLGHAPPHENANFGITW